MAISVNKVKNLVMFLLAKNNKGHITPMSFDAFADLAQRDIFENLFYKYNDWLVNQNKRGSNTGNADLPKIIQEQIDIFSAYSMDANFEYDAATKFWSFTGDDFYRTMGLTLKNAQGKGVDVEETAKGPELNQLLNSTINCPTTTYPVYIKLGRDYRVYPEVPEGYELELYYLRTPKTPKWTYVNVGGNPVFNAGAVDRQDFEIAESLFPQLVVKILGYCGLSLKEQEVVQVANVVDQTTEQKQQS